MITTPQQIEALFVLYIGIFSLIVAAGVKAYEVVKEALRRQHVADLEVTKVTAQYLLEQERTSHAETKAKLALAQKEFDAFSLRAKKELDDCEQANIVAHARILEITKGAYREPSQHPNDSKS